MVDSLSVTHCLSLARSADLGKVTDLPGKIGKTPTAVTPTPAFESLARQSLVRKAAETAELRDQQLHS